MKGFVLLLIASASLLASCQESNRIVGVNGTESGISLEASAASGEATMWSASLTGAEETPPNGSLATGIARFHLMHDGSIKWSLRTTGLDSVVAAHIHPGIPGQAGPPLVTLFSGEPTGDLNIRGEITDAAQVALVLDLIEADSAYVNVHTITLPGGEIRGQVVPKETGGGGSQP